MSKYEIVTRDQKRQWVAMIHGLAGVHCYNNGASFQVNNSGFG